jgi:hypothetical protein
MKNIIPFLLSLLLLAPGCSTPGGLSPATIEIAAAITADAAALVLQKNPKAVPALRSVSAGLALVLTTESLTQAQVTAFVSTLSKDAALSPAEQLLLGRAVQRVHSILTAHFATPDLNIADPRVRAALERIKLGIDDTLALYAALNA